jgi:hypothetical protein
MKQHHLMIYFLQSVSYAKHSTDDIQIGKCEGCTKKMKDLK